MSVDAALAQGMPMKRALLLCALLASCSLRDPHASALSCANSAQCSSSDVCFLGECRPPAANLSIVRVEVRPPIASQFGLKEQQLDLRQRVQNDFTLAAALAAAGTVTQEQDGAPAAPVPGAIVTMIDHAPVIPDRVEQIVSTTDPSGKYSARVPQGLWDVVVRMPPPLPPIRAGLLDTASPAVDFLLPRTSSFPVLEGGLTFDGGLPLEGASVTALDSQGAAISSPVVSQADGGYALYLPPDAGQPALQVGPTVAADGGVSPSATFPTYHPLAYGAMIDLPLPPVATLSGRVLDTLDNPVPSALVYVRTVGMSWSLARSVVTDAAGAYSVPLREGSYVVQAAPPPDTNAPALSAQVPVSVPTAGPVDLICPAKVRRFGQVLGPDGRPVAANFQIVATRLADGLVTNRTVSISTDANGNYRIVADAGRWRFELVPPSDARLPRKIVQVDLDGSDPGESALPTVQISTPLKVWGTVKGTAPGVADSPIAGALVSFFALDASGHSVFLGSAITQTQSSSVGQYEVTLPDVAEPGI
jgi:hypothetical protein